MNLAEHALKQLSNVQTSKKKAPLAPVRLFMVEHKDLIESMIRNGGTTTTISKAFDLPSACVRKHLSVVCGAEVKAICTANGKQASANVSQRK